MSRGRLIFPFLADVRRLSTSLTAADPDGAGALTSGYDPDFKEPLKLPVTGGGPGTTNRVEAASLLIPCQVEVPRFGQRNQGFSGAILKGQLILVFHFNDLEVLGLIDGTTNEATLHVGDRLAAVFNADGTLSQSFARLPLFASEVQPNSFGLTSLRRNLLMVTFDQRDTGSTSAA